MREADSALLRGPAVSASQTRQDAAFQSVWAGKAAEGLARTWFLLQPDIPADMWRVVTERSRRGGSWRGEKQTLF